MRMRYIRLLLVSALLIGVLSGCTISGTISLGNRGMVYGYVRDAFGPVQEALVEIPGVGWDRTRLDGSYEIPYVPAGVHDIVAQKSPFGYFKGSVWVGAGERVKYDIRF